MTTNTGIIPAYAGSTKILKLRVHRLRDHPRIRGEHEAADAINERYGGSSPHTRGARDVSSLYPAILADHPRIRGEHHLQSGL